MEGIVAATRYTPEFDRARPSLAKLQDKNWSMCVTLKFHTK